MSEFKEDPGMATYEELIAAGNALAAALLDVVFLAKTDCPADGGMPIAAKPLADWKALIDRTAVAQAHHLRDPFPGEAAI